MSARTCRAQSSTHDQTDDANNNDPDIIRHVGAGGKTECLTAEDSVDSEEAQHGQTVAERR